MKTELRNKVIRVLATEREHREIKAAAERVAIPVAVYVRSAALEKARKDTLR
jgi:mobilization protein NikA